MAIELQEIGTHGTVIAQDTREIFFLFQRLFQSFSGECGLLPQHNEHQ